MGPSPSSIAMATAISTSARRGAYLRMWHLPSCVGDVRARAGIPRPGRVVKWHQPFDGRRKARHHLGRVPNGSESRETIGERLKRLRVEHELSQRALASPGVSYAYISRIEAGTRQPSMKAL